MIKILNILFLIVFLTGCVEQKIIDDINIMSGVGYDAKEDGKVKGTIVIPVYKADKSISNESFVAEAKVSKEINRQAQMKSADPLENGSIEIVLFGKELAERGLYEITDTFERDAGIGSRLYLAVVDGTADEIMQKNLGNLGTGSYLNTLLEHNMRHRELPLSNLHLFMYSYYSKVQDPFLPYVKLTGNKVKVQGIALFDHDRAVDYLNSKDMFFFKALMENFRNGAYTFNVGKDIVTTYNITTKRKYDIKDPLTQPKVNLYVELEAHIREYTGKKLDSKVVDQAGKAFEEAINKKTKELLERFRDQKIDPIGIGVLAKTQTRKFDPDKWNEVYQNATFHVSSKVLITETGVIE
ncbi:Ger(x)C family spore germination protein [Robertmurraya korlensis]|uniref:Ger(x)C family spore germination protein n=1 Tax=Robertmurraya korlensis TaxID=519977 RepID=UPI0020425B35|nr:Ger(x)C family spore germination protein [Robertmurraya korlensis]MCM3600499.1 Ger(x)C family spore germination protein [Robertmurraya korlensis]